MSQSPIQSRLKGSVESLKEPALDEFCASCSKIPFEHLFQFRSGEDEFQYRLDRLDALRQRERTCQFCRFLASTYEHIFSPLS